MIDSAFAKLPVRIVTETVSIAGRQFQLRRPESADALFDLITEQEFADDQRLPYWADIWPSARVLAERAIAMHGEGRRLLELGCGVGLVSLAAGEAGFSVLATDYYGEALDFAAANARLNDVSDIATRLIDWRNYPDDLGLFDVILAADVLYERPNAPLVAAALARSLSADGIALVSDPGRRAAEHFPADCRDFGLHVVEVEHVAIVNDSIPLTIHIYEVRRSSQVG
jgi:predicted nicotinamide N-methyase